MIENCGPLLTDVLLHKVDVLEVLFPAGSMDLAISVYEEDPISFTCNQIVAKTVGEMHCCMSKSHCFEIGSGTGGTTSFILPVMNAWNTTFIFTDLSDAFLVKALVRFQHFPFLQYTLFDASTDAQEQGFLAYQFDSAVATNVIHATLHLPKTMGTIHSLLRAFGKLIFNEISASSIIEDVTFGLTDGWWLFADFEIRCTYPLLQPSSW
eukprot:gnl/MRDRNA2_/MRDRNA2_86766_c0_seq2.p1 gnl/MRDRNA2_/MRDRNA2_86766_c0~~gnl/MRDRNA2_/MRDRNA2_86766_c0_seq2.p1  ORF type:complete len:209 (+),score=30.09 gnl/MRDRNA2_/MRDRNA2_86766_c0_seq2:2353-2979(+)